MVVKIGYLQVHCVQYSNLSVQNHFWNKTVIAAMFRIFPNISKRGRYNIGVPPNHAFIPLDLPLPLCL